MKNTLMATAIIVPLCILIPLGLALLINAKPPGYKIYRAIIYQAFFRLPQLALSF